MADAHQKWQKLAEKYWFLLILGISKSSSNLKSCHSVMYVFTMLMLQQRWP